MSRFKIKLYLFLSRFIPYFKQKMRESILNSIDNQIRNSLKSYSDFQIDKGVRTLKEKYYKIGYDVTYQNIRFSIFIEYEDSKISKTLNINANNIHEELLSISDFYQKFREIPDSDFKTIIEFGK